MTRRYSETEEILREQGVRLESLRVDISKRLGNACSDLGPEEFAALVEKIARVQLRGERRAR